MVFISGFIGGFIYIYIIYIYIYIYIFFLIFLGGFHIWCFSSGFIPI